jgi:hypothetical protein
MIWNSILPICVHRRHLRLDLFDPSSLPDAFSSSAVDSSLESTLRRNWLRLGRPGRGRDWLRSGKRCVRSGARRRSIRIVKEQDTQGLQLHHRGTPRARSGNPLKRIGVVAVDIGAGGRFSREQSASHSRSGLPTGRSPLSSVLSIRVTTAPRCFPRRPRRSARRRGVQGGRACGRSRR